MVAPNRIKFPIDQWVPSERTQGIGLAYKNKVVGMTNQMCKKAQYVHVQPRDVAGQERKTRKAKESERH